MAYIYKITNDINQKIYIGKTEFSIEKRFKEHCRDAYKDSLEKRPLYSAIRKYGSEHFYIELVEETDNPEEREIYWIEYYNSFRDGYNATKGGDGKCIYNHKLILSLLKENPNPKVIAEQIGCCVDIVYKIAKENDIKVINIGQQKIKDNATEVHQYDKKTKKYIQSFSSNSEAAQWCYNNNYTSMIGKTARSHIGEVARGQRKTAYGFIWSYELKEKLD